MKNKKLFAILTLVCFMFTLMPVAAFAADVDAETSSFVAVDGDQTLKLDKAITTGVAFEFDLNDANESAKSGDFIIWAENASGDVTSALQAPVVADGDITADATEVLDNVYKVTASAANGNIQLYFVRAGEYTVYAAQVASKTVDSVDDLQKFDCDFSVITVKSATTDAADYDAVLSYNNVASETTDADDTFWVYDANGDEVAYELDVTPNNVMSNKVYVNFYDAAGKALKNETVYIDVNSSAIAVNKASDVTNSQGEIDFKVSASIEGEYEVILTIDNVEWTLVVNVGNTDAAYIETADQPKAPQALNATWSAGTVAFEITDINGNEVKAFDAGMDGIAAADGKYIVLTEKPADSDLESDDLSLAYDTTDGEWDLLGVTMDAEGDYAVKVILDNGAYATAEWSVKKFGTPVKMYFSAGVPAQVELGRAIVPTVKYVDANGVEKVAKASDITIAVNGYAVDWTADANDYTDNTNTTKYSDLGANYENGYIKLKTDEKYVGSEVTVTAISDKYDMTCTNTVTVVEVAGIAFDYDALKVDVNNKVDYFLADANGKMVRVNSNTATVKYIVIDKPEGAKVSVRETESLANSEGQFAITSDTVGNVTVQVIASVELSGDVTEYYTGVVVLPIGMENTGDVVVMSIGSNYIVLNNEIKEIPAPAMIKDARTFVPFRAIGEAFGAEVAWDAATQSVTAELNGVTVVLTIGSNIYTVNGVEKTADVAPYIAGDGYTMVPARLIAEAFGGEVLFTTDANGATADVLFLM